MQHRNQACGSLVVSAAGAVGLFGLPGVVAPMRVGVDSLDYVYPALDIHRDMAWFRKNVAGLKVARVWIRPPPGGAVDPEFLRGIDRFATAVEALPRVSGAVGPTTFLRMRRYLSGQGDRLPQDREAFESDAADVEQLLLTEPELRAFLDVGTLGNAQLTVIFEGVEEKEFHELTARLRRAWDNATRDDPAFRGGDAGGRRVAPPGQGQKCFEKDKALERRFQPVMVNEPDAQDAISILRGIKEKYETHHHVRITDEAIIAAVELSQRYISDRFLPDKAIDLIDEAASKLPLEINSVPEELEIIERRIRQLEIEREAIKREKDQEKLKVLNEEIGNLSEERNRLKSKWQSEKDLVEKIQARKNEIESLKFEDEVAERRGDLGKVAEIRYGRIPDAEKVTVELKGNLTELQKDSAMVNEEVGAEEIAEVVSRWAGSVMMPISLNTFSDLNQKSVRWRSYSLLLK